MSLRRHLVNLNLRLLERPFLSRISTPEQARERLEKKARFWFRSPRGTQVKPLKLGDGAHAVPGLSVLAPGADASTGCLLYFHGGGYFFGSPRTHQAMLAHLSARTGMMAVLPAYRLAPENPFPGAVEDALQSYRALLAQGVAAEKIVLGGDSAGGGLALALLSQLRLYDLPQPRCCFALSPWTDLSGASPSMHSNAASEAVLPPERMPEVAARYLQGAAVDDPRASPLFADFSGAAPVYLTASTSEILRDDTTRMMEALKSQDVTVRMDICHAVPHVWQLFHGVMPEAKQSLDRISDFVGNPRV